jgi:hypothetical protein
VCCTRCSRLYCACPWRVVCDLVPPCRACAVQERRGMRGEQRRGESRRTSCNTCAFCLFPFHSARNILHTTAPSTQRRRHSTDPSAPCSTDLAPACSARAIRTSRDTRRASPHAALPPARAQPASLSLKQPARTAPRAARCPDLLSSRAAHSAGCYPQTISPGWRLRANSRRTACAAHSRLRPPGARTGFSSGSHAGPSCGGCGQARHEGREG